MSLKSVVKDIVARLTSGRPTKGVPDVMLLVAALDGRLLPEEVEAYRHLALKCPGCREGDIEANLLAALRSAGYLLALAASGAADEKMRINAFVEEAMKVLPRNFTASLDDVRYALTLWTAMAISDDDYAGIEMKALSALQERLAETHLQLAESVSSSAALLGEETGRLGAAGEYMRVEGERVAELLRADCLAAAKALLAR